MRTDAFTTPVLPGAPLRAGTAQRAVPTISNEDAAEWFLNAKFGLSMHWGLYSVPARQSEWCVHYMYGGNARVMRGHIAKYGPPDKFG
jgi:Alpha-L-fucosidase